MSRFIETLKIQDGHIHNVAYHNRRMNAVRKHFFDCNDCIALERVVPLPEQQAGTILKGRILYNQSIQDIQWIPYDFPKINSLKLVYDDTIEYNFKFQERSRLKALFDQRGDCDDVLIIKDGLVTDSYFCNVVFEKSGSFYTPETCLLKGTRRQQLLDNKKIQAASITDKAIFTFEKIHLINALISLKDQITIDINNVYDL